MIAAHEEAPVHGASVLKVIRKFATRVILRAFIEWRNRVSFEFKMRSWRAFQFPYSFFRAFLSLCVWVSRSPTVAPVFSSLFRAPSLSPTDAEQKDQRPICQPPDTGSPGHRNLVKLFRRSLPRNSRQLRYLSPHRY